MNLLDMLNVLPKQKRIVKKIESDYHEMGREGDKSGLWEVAQFEILVVMKVVQILELLMFEYCNQMIKWETEMQYYVVVVVVVT